VSEANARPLVTHVDVSDGWEQDEETGGLVRMVRDEGSVMVGLWKPGGAAGRKIEYMLARTRRLSCWAGAAKFEWIKASRSRYALV
jgi:hypothetical protein